MFHYPSYRFTDVALIRRFVARFPLATITMVKEGAWHCSHIPLFYDEKLDDFFGHVDAKNTQFATAESFDVYLVFNGPNAYIPPEGYATRQLPTWNYLSVHVEGKVSIIRDAAKTLEILQRSALTLSSESSNFQVENSDPRVQQWIGGIYGLRIAISQIEGRFKLSQDKKPADVLAAAKHFAKVAGEMSSFEHLLEFSGQTHFKEELL